MTPKTPLTKLIKPECCGLFVIYGRLELVFLNCYCHWSSLILQNMDCTANIIHSKEGATQGDPINMVAYSILLLFLIKPPKAVYIDVTKLWYTDNAGALATFDNVELYFISLKHNGPAGGYFPYPTKIILILHPEKLKRENCLAQYTCH